MNIHICLLYIQIHNSSYSVNPSLRTNKSTRRAINEVRLKINVDGDQRKDKKIWKEEKSRTKTRLSEMTEGDWRSQEKKTKQS